MRGDVGGGGASLGGGGSARKSLTDQVAFGQRTRR